MIEGDFQAPNWLDLQRLHHNPPRRRLRSSFVRFGARSDTRGRGRAALKACCAVLAGPKPILSACPAATRKPLRRSPLPVDHSAVHRIQGPCSPPSDRQPKARQSDLAIRRAVVSAARFAVPYLSSIGGITRPQCHKSLPSLWLSGCDPSIDAPAIVKANSGDVRRTSTAMDYLPTRLARPM